MSSTSIKTTLLIVVLVVLFAIAGWMYKSRIGPATAQLRLHEAYSSPFGYKLSYPKGFRFARRYVNFVFSIGGSTSIDASDTVLALTMATEEEEAQYINDVKADAVQRGIDLSSPTSSFGFLLAPFALDKTIQISFQQYFDSIDVRRKDAAVATREALRKRFGYLPFDTLAVDDVTAADGTKGVMYIEKTYHEEGQTAPDTNYIYFGFPLKRQGVFHVNPVSDDLASYLQFRVDGDAPENLKNTLRQIIASLEFF